MFRVPRQISIKDAWRGLPVSFSKHASFVARFSGAAPFAREGRRLPEELATELSTKVPARSAFPTGGAIPAECA